MNEEAKSNRARYMKEYRDNNKQKINEYQKEWRKNNPEKIKQYQEKYWSKQTD